MIPIIDKWKVAAVGLVMVVIASLFGAAYIYKLQRDNARLKLSEFEAQVEAKAQEQQIRVQQMNEQSGRMLILNAEIYGNHIEEMNNEIADLESRNGSLAGRNTKLARDNAGMREAADYNRRALSGLLEATRLPAESGGDCHTELGATERHLEVVIAACKQTTIDYNSLMKSWDDECVIKGCE